jgi:hypothetical protein
VSPTLIHHPCAISTTSLSTLSRWSTSRAISWTRISASTWERETICYVFECLWEGREACVRTFEASEDQGHSASTLVKRCHGRSPLGVGTLPARMMQREACDPKPTPRHHAFSHSCDPLLPQRAKKNAQEQEPDSVFVQKKQEIQGQPFVHPPLFLFDLLDPTPLALILVELSTLPPLGSSPLPLIPDLPRPCGRRSGRRGHRWQETSDAFHLRLGRLPESRPRVQ